MRELSDELLLRIVRWSKIESLGRLAQTCQKWSSLFNDEQQWKERIFLELTKQPKLKSGESFKSYYKRNYDSPGSDVRYKKYLTQPLEHFSEEQSYEWCSKNSLDACLVAACAAGAEIWAEEVIKLGANLDRNFERRNGFIEAVTAGHLHIIDLLMSRGVNINFFIDNFTSHTTVFHAALDSPTPDECLKRMLSYQRKIKVLPRLHQAVIADNPQRLAQLLNTPGIAHNKLDRGGISALGWALILGRAKCIEILVKKGVSFEEVADSQYGRANIAGPVSALALAIEKKQLASVNLLLENEADPNAEWCPMDYGNNGGVVTPLLLAVEKDFPEGVQVLIQSGALRGVNAAFCKAAELGYFECLKNLRSAKPNVNYVRRTEDRDRKNHHFYTDTPLTCATKYGHADCVEFLLNNGANPNLTASRSWAQFGKNIDDKNNITPLHNAVQYLVGVGCLSSTLNMDHHGDEYREYLENKNAKIKLEFEREDYKPLDKKNILSQKAILSLELLLKHGANPDFTDSEKKSALAILIQGISKEEELISLNMNKLILSAIEILFMYKADIKKVNFPALHHALKLQNLELIKILIEKGKADVEEKDPEGNTFLFVVEKEGAAEVLGYLAEKGLASSRPITGIW